MLILVPSRGRPESLRRMFKSFADTETRAKVLIRIDEDDETMKGIAFDIPAQVRFETGPQVKSVGAMQEAIAMYPDEDCYAILGDDCVARTLHWDEKLRLAAGDWHIAFPDDMLKGETLAAHPVVGGKFIKALGFWALPGLVHLYQDKAIDFLGRLYGNLIYRPDVVVEHLHWTAGKSPMDATYERNFKGVPHQQHDHDTYTAWAAQYKKDPAIEAGVFEEAVEPVWKAAIEAGGLPFKQSPALAPAVTFVCLQAGNYCGQGARYVNTLLSMVRRNMKKTPFKFKCLTDDATGLDPGIGVIPLPDNLETWWGKLYLFKRGVLPAGERVIFLDLDTLVIGALDEICAYKGQFATLIDFYWPHQIGPGVMLWTPTSYTYAIWDEWEAEGRPRHSHGDWWWLNILDQGRFAHRCDKLQLLYPESFISWKVHCVAGGMPVDGANVNAKIIAFHGPEKPHNTDHPFVRENWK